MPIASSALDTLYTANVASLVAGKVRADVDEAVWLSVNGPRRRVRLRGEALLQGCYSGLDAPRVFLTDAVRAEVSGATL